MVTPRDPLAGFVRPGRATRLWHPSRRPICECRCDSPRPEVTTRRRPCEHDVDPSSSNAMMTADASGRSPLDAARRLAPSIRQRAEEIEEARELPRAVFEALADAGL